MRLVRVGEAEVDLEARRVRRPDQPEAPMTELEARLLGYLAERRGATVSREVLLAEVWGYAPSAVTRAVDHTVSRLRHKLELDAARPRWLTSNRGAGYRLEAEPRIVRPLPPDPTAFIGRSVDIGRIEAAIDAGPATVVVGLGGIGKSRLAVQVARGWEHAGRGEAVVVPLGVARTANDLLGALALALGVRADHALGWLAGRSGLLVVLDEVETLSDADLGRVLAVTGPRFLVTSQRPIDGAFAVDLGPMSADDGAALIQARSPVPVDPDAARRIARAVDAVPFAAELAARWLAVSTADEIVARLEHLRGVGVGRHQSVEAALASAWDRLDPDAQRILGYAMAFVGPVEVTDVEEVSGRSGLDRIVAGLVSAGWLRAEADGLTHLQLVERFVRSRDAVPADAADAHAAWLCRWLPAVHAGLRRRWDGDVLARIRRVEPDLRRALQVVRDPEQAALILRTLHYEATGRIPLAAALAEIEATLARLAPGSPSRSRLLHQLGALHQVAGQLDRAAARLDAATEAAATEPEAVHVANIAAMRATVGWLRGEDTAAALTQAIEVLSAADAAPATASYRSNLGGFRKEAGDLAGAEALFRQVIASDGARPRTVHAARTNLVDVYERLGRRDEADQQFVLVEAAVRAAPDPVMLGSLLGNRALHLLDRRDRRDRAGAARGSRAAIRASPGPARSGPSGWWWRRWRGSGSTRARPPRPSGLRSRRTPA
ncbi:MAG: winged helix-turn-helix domain-containing protein [Myxococcota bacterium]